MSTKHYYNIKYLEKKFGPMTFGLFVRSFREADGVSQTTYAKALGLSRANLCDIEKERKIPTPERAARLAKKMGVPEKLLVQLALQDTLRAAKLKYKVELEVA